MKPYQKNYLRYFGLDPGDIILCENCGAVAVDIHHIIYRSQQGTDDIENLMALCRKCHDKAHFKANPYISRKTLQKVHAHHMEMYKLTRF